MPRWFCSARTTTPVPTTTPAPTTPPAVANCNDLTGLWISENDVMCLQVDKTSGAITGITQRYGDTTWLDVVGMTVLGAFNETGWSAILPGTMGIQGYVGEDGVHDDDPTAGPRGDVLCVFVYPSTSEI